MPSNYRLEAPEWSEEREYTRTGETRAIQGERIGRVGLIEIYEWITFEKRIFVDQNGAKVTREDIISIVYRTRHERSKSWLSEESTRKKAMVKARGLNDRYLADKKARLEKQKLQLEAISKGIDLEALAAIKSKEAMEKLKGTHRIYRTSLSGFYIDTVTPDSRGQV